MFLKTWMRRWLDTKTRSMANTRRRVRLGADLTLEDRVVPAIDLVGSLGSLGDASGTSISADGRFVAFQSSVNNLVAGDTNGAPDLFVKDLQTGIITRANVAADGSEGTGYGYYADISADGRYVMFGSGDNTLVPGDNNQNFDIFRKDMQSGAIEIVSRNASGVLQNGSAGWACMSSDGRYVAFACDASNLINGTNGSSQLFVKDTLTGQVKLASVTQDGTQANDSPYEPAISDDGRYVAFVTTANNLAAGDTGSGFNSQDVFLKDTVSGQLTRVSIGHDESEPDRSINGGACRGPTLSADGRYLAFYSYADNLVVGDANGGQGDVFVRDNHTGTLTLVSADANNVQGNLNSTFSKISADGRYVAFSSQATNFGAGDDAISDVFVKDTLTGAISCVSIGPNNAHPSYVTYCNAISADGRFVAFAGSYSSGHEVFRASVTFASLSASVDGSDILTITDIHPVGIANQITVSRNIDGDIVITDANAAFESAPAGGVLSNDDHTLIVPLGLLSGIVINGGAGNDSLTVDLSGGSPIPYAGLDFNGGGPTTGTGDELVITGGNQGTVTYNATNGHDGSIQMSAYGGLGFIRYTGLEPITNTGDATDIIFNLPAAASDAVLEDDGTIGNSLSRLRSVNGTFESVAFANPTGSLTINRGNAVDTFAVSALPDFSASLTVGTQALPLKQIATTGPVSLAPNKAFGLFGRSLAIAGAVTTSAGDVTLSATNGATVSGSIATNGGALNVVEGTSAAPEIFADDFSAGASPLWGNEFGTWTASGGTYRATTPSGHPSASSSLPYILTDFTVDVDIGKVADGGIWLRSAPANTIVGVQGVVLVVKPTELYWHIATVADGSYALPLNHVTGAFAIGSNTHIRVVVSGDTYSAFVNGSSVAATTLTTTAFASGRVALYHGLTPTQTFDNVIVSANVFTLTGSGSLASGAGDIAIAAAAADIRGSIASTGAGSVALTTQRTISLGSGSSITTVNGDLSLSANQQATPAFGSFSGVDVNNATVQVTGSGTLTVLGKGGTTGDNQIGVWVHSGGSIQGGTSGAATVQGAGGAADGSGSYGIFIDDANSRITSAGGNVFVTGLGGSTGINGGSDATSYGVIQSSGAMISAAGSGTVTVVGHGGGNLGTPGENYGIYLVADSTITSSGGDVSVSGTGTAGSVANSHGIYVSLGSQISAGGMGDVTVAGVGGSGTGAVGSSAGVIVGGLGSTITSGGGSVSVTGTGGNTTGSNGNVGIAVGDHGTITAGGGGTVTVVGTGGSPPSPWDNNHGLLVEVSGTIASNGGDIAITATAGSGGNSVGVAVTSAGAVTTPISGNIAITADSMLFASTAGIDAGNRTVALKPKTPNTAISLGGADAAGALGLAAAELAFVFADTILLGDAASGPLTVSADMTRTSSTNVTLISAGSITLLQGSINTAGGAFTANADADGNGTGRFIVTGPAGSLDPTWNGSGTARTSFSAGDDLATSIAVQADGKIVVAGTANYESGQDDFALARYNADGSLDATFGDMGKVVTSFGPLLDQARGVAIQADGKIVVVGYTISASFDYDFAVARYNADGSLDTTFDGDGKRTIAIGTANDLAFSVALQADGKIVVAGAFNNNGAFDFALVRLDGDGSLDATFDSDGILTTAVGAGDDRIDSVIVQADGKIVAAGSSHNGSDFDFSIARYNSDGSLDTNFDGDGIHIVAIGNTQDIGIAAAIQADSKIVVAGLSTNGAGNNDFALVRFDVDGSLDDTFDGDGIATTSFPSTSHDQALGVVIQSDGKIVAVGSRQFGADIDLALARYNVDGSLDTSFDGDGLLTTSLGSSETGGAAVAAQTDGKIVVAGYSSNGVNDDFAVLRFQGHGAGGSINAGPGAITITAADASLFGAVVSSGTVALGPSLSGQPMDLGSDTVGSFSLTDAELDQIAAATLLIGAANAGEIAISADISRPTSTNIALISGDDIAIASGSINSGGGVLTLTPAATVEPTHAGVDATASTMAFSAGSDLTIAIEGAALDSGYSQLHVAGVVNLSGVDLILTGGHVFAYGETITIVSGTSRSGFFNGLADNASVPFGAQSLRIRYTETAVTLSFVNDPPATGTLRNPSQTSGDLFGSAIAISGTTAVVGAFRNDATGDASGRAYIYDTRTAGLVRTLDNPTPADGDSFGHAVAVSGNLAVIGAFADDAGADNSGSAYVFNVATGALVVTLNNPAPAIDDYFGSAVAIDGNLVVVGAYNHAAGTVGGIAYVFDATTGALIATLNNPTPAADDAFGVKIAISGTTVIVGAQADDTGALDSGAAYAFNALTGELLATFSNPTPAAGDGFGTAVAISGNTVITAANFDDTVATDSGTVYAFQAASGALTATINNPAPAAGDRFGNSVAISGNLIVVGANFAGAADEGVAYVFDSGSNALLSTIPNPSPGANDIFGGRVAVSGTSIIVSADSDDLDVVDQGAVYLTTFLTLRENTTVLGTITGSDPNAPPQTLTYSIIGGADEAKFDIDSNTNRLHFIAPPDFENPADAGGNNVYEVVVQISDGLATDSVRLLVRVSDVSATVSKVYVDDDFTSLPSGTMIADADPNTSGNQPATLGVNAFANLAGGFEAVAAGGTVILFAGAYAAPATIATNVTLNVPTGTAAVSGTLSGSAGLTKSGNGTLALTGANTFAGGLTINRGAVHASSDAALGASDGTIVVNAPGELAFTQSMTSSRSFDLNDGTLSIGLGATLTLDGGEILGGFVKGGPQVAPASTDFILNPANGHYYGLTFTYLDWTHAEEAAIAMGGHLASITSQAEQDFLTGAFVTPSTHGGEFQPFWIGLIDRNFASYGESRDFQWTTGEPLTYTNWSGGEPNNAGGGATGEWYVAFNYHYAEGQVQKGTWNDTYQGLGVFGDRFYQGIIELDSFPTQAAGRIATLPGVSTAFSGTTLRSSIVVVANGNDTFSNVTNAGAVSVAPLATVSLDGFTVQVGGELTVDGTANAVDFISYGQTTIQGTLDNIGGVGFSFGGGSVTMIAAEGEIDIGSANALVAGGLVKNFGDFGSTSNSVVVDFGGKVTGPGMFASVVTQNGGVYSPGASPGAATHAVFDVNGGGIFEFEIANATGTAGALDGWDMATVAPNVYSPSAAELMLSATEENTYTIVLTTRVNTGDRNIAGAAANFNPAQNYAWKFLDGSHTATNVTGTFAASAFNVVTSGFQNAATGTFSVERRDGGKSLYVVYTAPVLAPTVTGMVPVIGPTTGGTMIVINGFNFVSISSVTIGGVAASFSVSGTTQISVTTTAQVAGAVEVVVANATGSSSLAGSGDFTYATPALAAVVVNGGPGVVLSGSTWSLAGQNSVVKQILVTFNQAVTLASDAFTVTPVPVNASGGPGVVKVKGGAMPSDAAVTASIAATLSPSSYLITFSGPGTHGGGVIDSGVYDLTTIASKVSANGETMANNRVDTFFAVFGTIDANNSYTSGTIGNGGSKVFVDPGSLFQFSDAFGSSAANPSGPPAYNLVFDSNLDGSIDPGDLFAFSDSFGIDWEF